MSEQNQIQKAQPKEPTLKDLVASNVIQQKLARVAGKHFDHDRLAQAVLIMVNKNRDLQECTTTSLLDCMMVAAQQNWTIGGPRPGMYIVKYGNIATPIPSYFGFQETARDSDQEWEIEAVVVRDGDEFRYSRGLLPVLEHRPHDDEDAEITHAYAIARSKTGRVKFEVMNIDAIEAIRARSRAGTKGPWVTDYAEMSKKTVVRRLCKYLPSSPKMDAALEISDRGDDIEVVAREVPPQRMNLRQQAKGTDSPSPPSPGAAAPRNAPGSGTNAADVHGTGPGSDVKPPNPSAAQTPPTQPGTTDGPTDGPGASVNATGTTGEAREKQAGAVGAQSPTPPTGKRPKAKKHCLDCGAPLNDDGTCPGTANHAENMPERQHEPSKGVQQAEGVPPETVADAFAREGGVDALSNWLMSKAVPAKVRAAAMELAGVKTLVDAKEEDVRNVAYNAKLHLLQTS